MDAYGPQGMGSSQRRRRVELALVCSATDPRLQSFNAVSRTRPWTGVFCFARRLACSKRTRGVGSKLSAPSWPFVSAQAGGVHLLPCDGDSLAPPAPRRVALGRRALLVGAAPQRGGDARISLEEIPIGAVVPVQLLEESLLHVRDTESERAGAT